VSIRKSKWTRSSAVCENCSRWCPTAAHGFLFSFPEDWSVIVSLICAGSG
jgi:hypothetical protein